MKNLDLSVTQSMMDAPLDKDWRAKLVELMFTPRKHMLESIPAYTVLYLLGKDETELGRHILDKLDFTKNQYIRKMFFSRGDKVEFAKETVKKFLLNKAVRRRTTSLSQEAYFLITAFLGKAYDPSDETRLKEFICGSSAEAVGFYPGIMDVRRRVFKKEDSPLIQHGYYNREFRADLLFGIADVSERESIITSCANALVARSLGYDRITQDKEEFLTSLTAADIKDMCRSEHGVEMLSLAITHPSVYIAMRESYASDENCGYLQALGLLANDPANRHDALKKLLSIQINGVRYYRKYLMDEPQHWRNYVHGCSKEYAAAVESDYHLALEAANIPGEEILRVLAIRTAALSGELGLGGKKLDLLIDRR